MLGFQYELQKKNHQFNNYYERNFFKIHGLSVKNLFLFQTMLERKGRTKIMQYDKNSKI